MVNDITYKLAGIKNVNPASQDSSKLYSNAKKLKSLEESISSKYKSPNPSSGLDMLPIFLLGNMSFDTIIINQKKL